MPKLSKQNKPVENTENEDKTSVRSELLEWLCVAIAAVVIAFIIDTVFIVNAVIPSASMETTIMTGDRIFGNRLSYVKEKPQRGDIVIFKNPDNEKELFIKRIIGMPGETLEVKDGDVYINGSDTPLKEDYIREKCNVDFEKIAIPEGAYFMMGDNRNNSSDSRYWINHFVYEDKILGRAMFRYYPKLGKIENTSPVY